MLLEFVFVGPLRGQSSVQTAAKLFPHLNGLPRTEGFYVQLRLAAVKVHPQEYGQEYQNSSYDEQSLAAPPAASCHWLECGLWDIGAFQLAQVLHFGDFVFRPAFTADLLTGLPQFHRNFLAALAG